jgi:hypothetical protein
MQVENVGKYQIVPSTGHRNTEGCCISKVPVSNLNLKTNYPDSIITPTNLHTG